MATLPMVAPPIGLPLIGSAPVAGTSVSMIVYIRQPDAAERYAIAIAIAIAAAH